MSRYKMCFLLVTGCLSMVTAFAQDVGFSQFYEQPLLRNPGLAGVFTGNIRATASYRNQWESVTVPYRTVGLSAEFKTPVNFVRDGYATFGLQLLRDIAGDSKFSTMQIMPALTYGVSLSQDRNSYLSLGIMGGSLQQRFDQSKLQFNDQFVAGSNGMYSISPSSRQVFDNTSVNYLDASVGISYNGVFRNRRDDLYDIDYFIGAGLYHITMPEVSFFKGQIITLNRKFTANAGLSAPVSEFNRFILYADYFKQFNRQLKPVGISTIQAGAMLSLGFDEHTITFGGLYRMRDAIIPVVQVQWTQFMLGMSYDINIDKLAAASKYRGGFELTLSYRDFLNSSRDQRSREERRQSSCPRFGR